MNTKTKARKRSKISMKALGSTSSRTKPTEKGLAVDLTIDPLDTLMVKVFSLKLTDEDPYKDFNIKVSFMEKVLCSSRISSISARDDDSTTSLAEGLMFIDPADHDRMCTMADYPMTVHVSPVIDTDGTKLSLDQSIAYNEDDPGNVKKTDLKNKVVSESDIVDVSCCNIDILPLFIEKDKMLVKKRLEPMLKRSTLFTKSWCNLPLLSMEVSVLLDHSSERHHRLYHHANHMTITLVGAYNIAGPYHDDFNYVAATKIALGNENNSYTITFEDGQERPKDFSSVEFYPHWESLRGNDEIFTAHDCKWLCENGLQDIQNNDNIDLDHYLYRAPSYYTIIWSSFHRTVMPQSCEEWLQQHIRRWRWPLEVHCNHEERGYDYMAFLDLFGLLSPGVSSLRMAVPLQWSSVSDMMEACNCAPLLPTNDKQYDKASSIFKNSRKTDDTDRSATEESVLATGVDGNAAFVIIEVKLARPLVKIKVPQIIPNTEIDDMLKKIENDTSLKRRFTGRGQLDVDWRRAVFAAVAALRKVPYHVTKRFPGSNDVSHFMRQIAQSRTRAEVFTTFWQEAAIYVNNNFVVSKSLTSEEEYQKMLTAAFSCMMKVTVDTMFGPLDTKPAIDPVLRAARHARQVQDYKHAKNLYLYLISQHPENPDYWREFGSAMKHYKRNWAKICIDKSIFLNPRHPLTLIAKACTAKEDEAEIFFNALLTWYPFWYTGWIIVSTYYWKRQMYNLAEAIFLHIKKMERDHMLQEVKIARAWEHELGDWFDPVQILPGMCPFYDAADLLIRLRAVTMAKACVARALLDRGETPQYYYLLALCCRVSGNARDALCHLNEAIKKFTDVKVCYLRTLQAECCHLLKDPTSAVKAFEKLGQCTGPFSLLLSMPCRDAQRARSLLVDLVRRHPSSYTWMALADDWMMRSIKETDDPDTKNKDNISGKACAAACAIQALKWDRLCARAWALLSQIVPVPTRRAYYSQMAEKCGYIWKKKEIKHLHMLLNRPEHPCHRVGTALMECCCKLCNEVQNSIYND